MRSLVGPLVGLLAAMLAGLASWQFDAIAVPLVHLAAWCVALGLIMLRGQLTLPRLELAPIGKVLLGAFVMVGAVRMAAWRARVGIEGYEAGVLLDHDMPWVDAWVLDEGLPSYFHSLLIVPATWVGGVGLVFLLHTALYGVFGALVLDTTRRMVTPPAARLVTGMVMLAPTVLHQFVELRSYATFLTAVALGANALVPRRDDAVPAFGMAVLAFGLASLDNPLAGVLLGAVALAMLVSLRVDPLSDADRAQVLTALQAAAIVMGAAVGTALTALSVHRADGPRFTVPYGALAVLAVFACVVASGLSRRPLRSSRIVATGGIGALMVMWTRGHLVVEARYVLFLVPLVLPLVLREAHQRGSPRFGEVASWLALGATLLLWTSARHVGVPVQPDPATLFAVVDRLIFPLALVALAALTVAAIYPRSSPETVLALPWLLGAWGFTAVLWSWSAEDKAHGAITCTERHLALAVRSAGDHQPVCLPEGRLRPVWYAWARYAERSSVWDPLRRGSAVGLVERIVHTCPSVPHVQVLAEGSPSPEGCTALPAPHHHPEPHTAQVWACPAR